MYDAKVRNKFIELKGEGKSLDEISWILGVSKRSLNNWNQKYENEIELAEDLKLEELAQKLRITKGQRLRIFTRDIKSIDKELSGRSLKDISAKHLIDMKIKMLDGIGKTLDSSKIEFGTPLIITKDPYVEIMEGCRKSTIGDATVEELVHEIADRKATLEYLEAVVKAEERRRMENAGSSKESN